jgi:hypothetical protein
LVLWARAWQIASFTCSPAAHSNKVQHDEAASHHDRLEGAADRHDGADC